MNRINMFLGSLGKGARVLVLSLAVIFGSAAAVQAATTISTNILTGGTLGAYGITTLGATASTTISAAGVLTTPTLNSFGVSTFGGTASTTISAAGVLTARATTVNGTLGVIGVASFGATATSTFGTDGTLTIGGASSLTVTSSSTLASTTITSAKIGQLGTQITQVTKGYCSFVDVTLAASSTEGFATCTTVPTGALIAGDSVFVTATSSFLSPFVITAASTTGVSTIQLRIMNTGLGGAVGTLTGTSIFFLAVR